MAAIRQTRHCWLADLLQLCHCDCWLQTVVVICSEGCHQLQCEQIALNLRSYRVLPCSDAETEPMAVTVTLMLCYVMTHAAQY